MSELLEGYKFYKSIQGTRYAQGKDNIRIPLSNFRKLLGDFTDKIFVQNNKFISPQMELQYQSICGIDINHKMITQHW